MGKSQHAVSALQETVEGFTESRALFDGDFSSIVNSFVTFELRDAIEKDCYTEKKYIAGCTKFAGSQGQGSWCVCEGDNCNSAFFNISFSLFVLSFLAIISIIVWWIE